MLLNIQVRTARVMFHERGECAWSFPPFYFFYCQHTTTSILLSSVHFMCIMSSLTIISYASNSYHFFFNTPIQLFILFILIPLNILD
ncbi:hypothetical protein BC941DRAFT_434979, partial [Chlamydoabsidia padenii]